MRTGDKLQVLIRERKTSIRGLARQLAALDDGDTSERWRRDLNRYIHDGKDPSEEKAAVMEERLGLEHGYFPRYETTREMRLSQEERLAALERAAAAAATERAALTETLAELAATVSGLERTTASLRRRIAALEKQPPGEERGTGRAAR